MSKYILFIPNGGFNDCICCLSRLRDWAHANNRILLYDTRRSLYHINFCNYFDISDPNIIFDSVRINEICSNADLTVIPGYFRSMLPSCLKQGGPFYDTYINKSPPVNPDEDITVHCFSGGGEGYKMFKELIIKDNLKTYCKDKFKLLPEKYLCIQVRDTDRKCDYKKLYEDNRKYIDSYDTIYIATDNKHVYDFFKSVHNNALNYCVFPESLTKRSLHATPQNPDVKIKSMMCDLYIAAMSNHIISTSHGGFIMLLHACFENKQHITKMFD